MHTAIRLTAHVDDTTTGGSHIAAAEYSINGSNLVAMAAQDGAFDEVSEDGVAVVPPFSAAGVYEVGVLGTERMHFPGRL